MISHLRLKDFKCFHDETISFSALTVLSGINGMGKSSVLQALLLLRQSALCGDGTLHTLFLNGPLISLGNANDIIYEKARSAAPVSFTLSSQTGHNDTWSFNYLNDINNSDHNGILRADKSKTDVSPIPDSALFSADFCYLKAERIGPRTSFAIPNHELSRFNAMGSAGEYCAYWLSSAERQPLPIASLLHKSQDINELRYQTEAWLSEIGQSPRILLQEHKQLDLVQLEFSFIRNGLSTMPYRPTNVGFGLTYSLPIFVAVLSAKPDSLLLIENPEAHLHPQGQAAIGKFLALAAASGVQIVIETHSDHVLNGIRIAVKNKTIKPEEVTLHFFDRAKDDSSSAVTSPKIDKNGRLDQWPDGFFDEWEKGLADLL